MFKRYVFILVFQTPFVISSYSQIKNNDPVYEKIALEYLTDSFSILRNEKLCFTGWIDPSITFISTTLLTEFPNDEALHDRFVVENKSGDQFWKENKKSTFEITPNYSKHLIHKKKCSKNGKSYCLRIYQNLKIGQNNYVLIKASRNKGLAGYLFYCVMTDEGKIKKFVYTLFRI